MFDRATTATPTTVVNSAKLWSPWSFVVDVLLFLFSAIRRWQWAEGGEWGKWAKSNSAMLLANCSCALLLLALCLLCFVVSLSDLQHVLKRKFAKCDHDWLTTSIAVITFDAVVRRSWSWNGNFRKLEFWYTSTARPFVNNVLLASLRQGFQRHVAYCSEMINW